MIKVLKYSVLYIHIIFVHIASLTSIDQHHVCFHKYVIQM